MLDSVLYSPLVTVCLFTLR